MKRCLTFACSSVRPSLCYDAMNQPPAPTNNSGLRDNHSRGSAGDFLKESIEPGSELSFVSAYFTVHAYAALKEPLEAADHLRFLFGDPSSVTNLEKDKKQARHFVLGNERQELTLGNQLTQKQAARDCAAWIRNKVEIRSVTRSAFLHGKLYHIRKNGLDQAILGSSNFTVPGLGLKSSGNNVQSAAHRLRSRGTRPTAFPRRAFPTRCHRLDW